MPDLIRYDASGFFVLLHPSGRWHLIDEPYNSEREHVYAEFALAAQSASPTRTASDAGRCVIVFITEVCNLRCDYCKVAAMIDNPNKKATDREAILLSLQQQVSESEHPVTIVFYGGEPLLKHREIDWLCTQLEAATPDRCNFSVTTNGTLVTDDIVRVLLAHRISVGVSMDGPSAIHDANRRFLSGTGSHALVARNYKKLKESGVSCGPICVVADPARMIETFQYFSEVHGDDAIYLKPLDVTGREPVESLDIYFKALLEHQMSLLRTNIDCYARGGRRLVETYTLSKLRSVLFSQIAEYKVCHNNGDGNCAIGSRIGSVEADGARLACPTLKKHADRDSGLIERVRTKGGYCSGCAYASVCTSFCLGTMDSSYLDRFANSSDSGPLDAICRYNKSFIDSVFHLFREDQTSMLRYAQ